MDLSLWRHPGGFRVGGHRGASAHYRENTLAAVAGAIAAGADFIEADLRLTRDGVPVVAHDADFARLANDPRAVAALDFAEARRIHPDLMTVFDAIAAAETAGVLIDCKLSDPADIRHAATVLAPVLGGGRVAFGPRSLDAAAAVRAVVPDCPLLGLFQRLTDYAEFRRLGGTWARLWQIDASVDAIAWLHKLGLNALIMAGTPTHDGVGLITAEAIDRLIADGADGIMLNDPALAVARRALTLAA